MGVAEPAARMWGDVDYLYTISLTPDGMRSTGSASVVCERVGVDRQHPDPNSWEARRGRSPKSVKIKWNR